uniref:NADH-ubiquinone oxidoreductase chain 2 n=1 Tax=Idotea baltica TaxID=82763 RepID=Q19TX2_9CRUS|nr:NADH dehydrogenase subunit 2 [Idotea baltica]
MSKSFSVSMFFCSLVLGAVVAMSSSSWLGVWMGLELNLLSFIPIIMLNRESASVEAGLKYFLVQACSSLVVLQSGVYFISVDSGLVVLVVLALVMKVGGAPFHFWFPSVSEGLNWGNVMILFTIQKVAPLTLLFYLYSVELETIYYTIVILSGTVGAVSGFNEVLLRKLLSFSSISHLGWMILGMSISGWVWVEYLVFYIIITISLMFILRSCEIFHLSQIFSQSGAMGGVILGISFMSLGGLPPLVGFLPKWLLISSVSDLSCSLVVVYLIGMSLVTLFYYLRVGLSSFSLIKESWEVKFSLLELSGKEYIILFFNSLGLVLSGWV